MRLVPASMSAAPDTVEEARRGFDAWLGCRQVRMPFEGALRSAGVGTGLDRYGTPWMLNCAQAP